MKKIFPLLLLPLFLVSCGNSDNTVDTLDTTSSLETEMTIENTMASETTTIWTPLGEQSNLAPSDTPRGIAEGGIYLPYTPTALAQASGNIVLFFYASWAPASIATNKDIIDKKDTLPKDLTILRVNFDDVDAMKQQYGVTEQQTFVQVSNTGELIKKWRGANTLADIIQQIQK